MSKPKILVVEDEPLNMEFMEETLSKDYAVAKASGGIDALIAVENNPPDLILLDILMPNMNGYAVCRELKTNKKTMAIPIVMITALREKEDKAKAKEAGADDFISKPIDIAELKAKLKSLLSARDKKIS